MNSKTNNVLFAFEREYSESYNTTATKEFWLIKLTEFIASECNVRGDRFIITVQNRRNGRNVKSISSRKTEISISTFIRGVSVFYFDCAKNFQWPVPIVIEN